MVQSGPNSISDPKALVQTSSYCLITTSTGLLFERHALLIKEKHQSPQPCMSFWPTIIYFACLAFRCLLIYSYIHFLKYRFVALSGINERSGYIYTDFFFDQHNGWMYMEIWTGSKNMSDCVFIINSNRLDNCTPRLKLVELLVPVASMGIRRWTGLSQLLSRAETLEVMEHPELRFAWAWLSHNMQYITCSEDWEMQADRCPGPVVNTLVCGMEACRNKCLFSQIIEETFWKLELLQRHKTHTCVI